MHGWEKKQEMKIEQQKFIEGSLKLYAFELSIKLCIISQFLEFGGNIWSLVVTPVNYNLAWKFWFDGFVGSFSILDLV